MITKKLASHEESLSKLLSMKQIADGVVGELFEVFICNKLEPEYVVEHIGKQKEKADLTLNGKRYSCKVTGSKARSIKVHHGISNIPELKTFSKRKMSVYLLNNIEFLDFIFLSDREQYGYISIASIAHLEKDIVALNFTVSKNEKSVSINFECGESINISSEYMFLNKKCFKSIEKTTFSITQFNPYKLLGELF